MKRRILVELGLSSRRGGGAERLGVLGKVRQELNRPVLPRTFTSAEMMQLRTLEVCGMRPSRWGLSAT
jgi:hypothetical protein